MVTKMKMAVRGGILAATLVEQFKLNELVKRRVAITYYVRTPRILKLNKTQYPNPIKAVDKKKQPPQKVNTALFWSN